jgi:AcrR family transcriptional regulator
MTDQSVIMNRAPVADKEADKRLRILDAARRLLVERGFQDLALDDVAKKAGVAKGTLFLYYRSKEDLFEAAFADLVDKLGATLEAALASPLRGRERLDEAARIVLQHFDEHSDFMAQFGAGRFPGCGSRSSGRLLEKFAANLSRMTKILKACADDGLIRGGDLEASAAFLFALCRSSILYNMMKNVHRPLSARRVQVVEMFLNGVGKR